MRPFFDLLGTFEILMVLDRSGCEDQETHVTSLGHGDVPDRSGTLEKAEMSRVGRQDLHVGTRDDRRQTHSFTPPYTLTHSTIHTHSLHHTHSLTLP